MGARLSADEAFFLNKFDRVPTITHRFVTLQQTYFDSTINSHFQQPPYVLPGESMDDVCSFMTWLFMNSFRDHSLHTIQGERDGLSLPQSEEARGRPRATGKRSRGDSHRQWRHHDDHSHLVRQSHHRGVRGRGAVSAELDRFWT